MVRRRSLGRPARLSYQTAPLLTEISENGVRLRLNIVDTPGYGDLINNEGWCAPKIL
jgi:septin 3/9/12